MSDIVPRAGPFKDRPHAMLPFLNSTFMVLLLLFYLLIPAGIIWLCRKVAFLNKIGPILILYILGVIVGNMPFLPEGAASLQNILSSAIIPIAIPMMLFNLNFRRFSVRKSMLTLVCGIVAVVITVVCGYIIFRNVLGPEGYKIGGMLTGVYTGGTPNLAALKLMLNVPNETYILLNSYDMIVSFLYLIFLMSFGIKFFRKILPNTGITATGIAAQHQAKGEKYKGEPDPYVGIFKWKYFGQIIAALGLSLLILAVSFGIAGLAGGGFSRSFGEIMDANSFMVVLILSLTTMGILASFAPGVQKLEKSYDAGMYLVYIFSVVVASMADLSNLDFKGGIYMFLFIVFVIFGSIIIQTLLSKILRIDADTMVISSVALVNSPPLVPMMAAAMKNKDAIITGLTVGIVGYAAGNYLGLIISQLLHIM